MTGHAALCAESFMLCRSGIHFVETPRRVATYYFHRLLYAGESTISPIARGILRHPDNDCTHLCTNLVKISQLLRSWAVRHNGTMRDRYYHALVVVASSSASHGIDKFKWWSSFSLPHGIFDKFRPCHSELKGRSCRHNDTRHTSSP